MSNLQIALCDQCEDYIIKLASYLMEHSNASFHIFTTPESFFEDANDYDIALLTEDYIEVSSFKPKGIIKHKYLLSESRDNSNADCIYKYQSAETILGQIKELLTSTNSKSNSGTSKFVGVYAPVMHELESPFSMALTQVYGTKGKVLFLDLEEISILPNQTGSACERNLMDYLHGISTGKEKIDLSDYVKSYMGFDYIAPFLKQNEIDKIDKDTWARFFDVLSSSEYDVIVVLFGKTVGRQLESICAQANECK